MIRNTVYGKKTPRLVVVCAMKGEKIVYLSLLEAAA